MKSMENVTNKIKKLLSKTVENGCSESEAAIALAKARELMYEYKIETLDTVEQEEIVTIETKSNINTPVKRALFLTITKRQPVCVYFSQKIDMCNGAVMGYKRDCEYVMSMFDCAFEFIDKYAEQYAYNVRKMFGTAKGVKNQVILGFAKGLESKFNEQDKSFNALILKPTDEVVEHYNDVISGSESRQTTVKLKKDSDAFLAGYHEGSRFGTTELKEGVN